MLHSMFFQLAVTPCRSRSSVVPALTFPCFPLNTVPHCSGGFVRHDIWDCHAQRARRKFRQTFWTVPLPARSWLHRPFRVTLSQLNRLRLANAESSYLWVPLSSFHFEGALHRFCVSCPLGGWGGIWSWTTSTTTPGPHKLIDNTLP